MSNNQKNLLSLMLGCVLAFGFLEVLFRLPVWMEDPLLPIFKLNSYIFQDQDDVVRYVANASGGHLRWDGESHLIGINEQGFRGEPVGADEQVDVLLGDSVVFNGGVSAAQALDTWLTQSGGRRVLNYGVSGTSLYHYQQRFEQDLMSFAQVKRVYLCFYLNDFIRDPIPPFIRSSSKKSVTPAYSFRSYALAQMGLLIRCAVAIYTVIPDSFAWVEKFHQGAHHESIERWNEVRRLAKSEWGSAWEPERWSEFEQRVGEMSRQGREQGIELVIVIFPVELQVSPKFWSEEMGYPQRQATKLAEKWKVPVIDLLPVFREQQEKRLFFDHCHLTPEGNRIAAEEILRFNASEIGSDPQ